MSDTSPSSANSWLTLLLAGGFEVGYALSVGGSHGFTRLTWSLVAVAFFLLTLWALSAALRTIDVALGYAVWAGIGSAGAALLGPVLFDETLTTGQALWLGLIIVGVVWLKLADRQQGGGEPGAVPQDGQEAASARRETQGA
ncbi:DMT family transporter [Streptomyces montanisoli]|uniref:Multidrug efflux SMR transporter n=1 Tax=Streptomyces montanisoli TaxID=2798581 RepID=A0A940S0Q6_9ACTN|nr:multidrug efflux SMR transporter [Streptomyces montanisoli]MBP0461543.1 multidrug efflux SMR transporter [Streptomyces montanisoli]